RSWRSMMASNCPETAARCWAGVWLLRTPAAAAMVLDDMPAALMGERSMAGKSVDDQVGLEGAGALQGLEDRHHVAGGDAEGVQGRGQALDRRGLVQDGEAALGLVDVGLGAGDDHGLDPSPAPGEPAEAAGKAAAVGLAHAQVLGHGDG